MGSFVLYNTLKKEHRFYTIGKRSTTLIAACEYLESRMTEHPKTQKEVAEYWGVNVATVRTTSKKIVKLMNLEDKLLKPKTKWQGIQEKLGIE